MSNQKLHKKISYVPFLMVTVTVLFACNKSSLISNNKEPAFPTQKEEYVKDEVIVKFKEGATENRIKEIIASLGCEIIRSIGTTRTFLIKIKTGASVNEVIGKYKQFDEVEYAQPNYLYHPLEGK